MSDPHQPDGKDPLPANDETQALPARDAESPSPRGSEVSPPTEAYDDSNVSSLEDSFDTSVLSEAGSSASIGRLGKYEILRLIGQGGMGVVFRGFDESLHRPIAIKVLSRQLATSPTARRRFTREARAAAAINHPNVVTIHAVEDHEGLPYLVMEFVAGESLHDRIRAQAPLPLADVLRIGSQIAAGLSAAHAQGVIHRDIKPANIMLEANVDRVKITDFGLARVAMDNAELTSQGNRLGTPAYMSPEQVNGAEVDDRTDLFSLGCVLYAMVTSHSPFGGTHAFDAARKVLQETPESLDRVDPSVPPFLAEIVDRLLAKNPSSRFQTAGEVGDLLNHYMTKLNQTRTDELETALLGERLGPANKKSRGKILLAVAVAIAGLAAALIARPWADRGNELEGGPAAAAEDSGPPSEPALLRGTLTVSQSGDSQFESLNDALQRAGRGATIEVVDDATYHEALAIADPERLRDVTILSRSGAKLTAPFNSSVIKIDSTPGVTVRGFQLEAFAGQHGIEVTGPCPGALLDDIAARRVPNPNSPSVINFVYFHAGAAGTEDAPIVLRGLRLTGDGHGIAIGELAPSESDKENPVRWVRVEDCTVANPSGRNAYRLFLLNYVEDIVVTRNTFADATLGISILMKEPNQGRRVRIHQNSFHNLGGLITVVADFAQDDLAITSNLISRTDGVTARHLPPSALPTTWFSANAWIDDRSTTDAAVPAVATIVQGVAFETEDSASDSFLRPTAESLDSLRSVGSPLPGRFARE